MSVQRPVASYYTLQQDKRRRQRFDVIQTAHVDIWAIPVECYAERLDSCLIELPEEERIRATRFIFEKDRRVFTVTRWSLRRILAEILGQDMTAIQLAVDIFGRPYIEGRPDLDFNISHSGQLSVISLCRESRIGIDVEMVDAKKNLLEIAKRVFSPEEVGIIQDSNSETERMSLFYRLWTLKEAVIKADGRGFSLKTTGFSLTSVIDGGWARIGGSSFYLIPLEIAASTKAALAVKDQDCTYSIKKFDLD
jgi:phosphopantetheinyl transferase